MGGYVATLDEAFLAYLRAKTPRDYEKTQVSQQRSRIQEALEARFRLIDFFQSGSFSHGTAVSPYSDVDYIARIHNSSRPQSSNSALRQVRETLVDGLPGVRSVEVDTPAVRVVFDYLSAETEVTPAFLHKTGTTDAQSVLFIPGPAGSWREAAPKAHLAYVREQNNRHGGMIKGLARLLKAWKYEQSVLISSFYLELRAAQYGAGEEWIYYLTDVRDILNDLVRKDLRDMNDPTHLVSRIHACSYESYRPSALGDARRAADLMSLAVEAWLDNEPFIMSDHLQAVFGEDFPTVYGDLH